MAPKFCIRLGVFTHFCLFCSLLFRGAKVYDLMTKLAELAVTSHRPTLRATSGQTFLTFLLQYPLGEKRLQFHLNQVSDLP